MSTYQIGKDIQDILTRLEYLERERASTQRSERKAKLIGKTSDDILHLDQLNSQVSDAQSELLSVDWHPPFGYTNTWDSGSGGNLHIDGGTRSIPDSGECRIAVQGFNRHVDNSDKASRFAEAYFGFGYRNPFKKGKLEVKADFFIERAIIDDYIYDEVGVSAIDLIDFQRFALKIYKQVEDGTVRIGLNRPDIIRPSRWDYNSGYGNLQHNVEIRGKNEPIKLISEDTLDINQTAYIYAGIWSGLSLWTNDYGFKAYNYSIVQLKKVSARIIPA